MLFGIAGFVMMRIEFKCFFIPHGEHPQKKSQNSNGRIAVFSCYLTK